MLLSQKRTLTSAHSRCAKSRTIVAPRAYLPPSSTTAASELQLIQRHTEIVPDTLLGSTMRAATVSYSSLNGIVAAESLGLRPYQNAILTALNYDRCRSLPDVERAQCLLNKALVNVGAMFAKEVEGRVCTEIDARLANDTSAMIAAGQLLNSLYNELGIKTDKLIFRLPGTWSGIQAAKALEAKGIPTQVFLVFSMVQAIAAAQAGVSVIQPSVGRVREWYNKNPGVPRDPHGPREDSGCVSAVDPGLALVTEMYNYIKQYHPRTCIMATAIRTAADATALSGLDFMVVPQKIITELSLTSTAAGYNDGLHATETSEEGTSPSLSLQGARDSGVAKVDIIDEKTFNERLGMAGSELLNSGLKQQVDQAEQILPYFAKSITSSASL